MNNAPILKLDNILLRKPKIEDIQARILYGRSAEFVKMCGGDTRNMNDFTLEDANSWYVKILKHPCKWVVEINGDMVGTASLSIYSDDNKASYAMRIFNDTLFGKGIGTKVTNMVLEYAFTTLKLHRVDLRVLEYNKRAIRCYEKCGFVQEGIEREGAYIEDEYVSDIMMSILQHEYVSNHKCE